ncbi:MULTISPECIES: hypothetical protein [unclassified Mycobacterium]|uniref:hypothetical protein n=1 Tax=unclassified Mycobacterium TaxID=2642494 RepID=UPI00074028B2|nr:MULTISPECIES: hypothetical protein [unclassified Mycobacterium]KUH81579.1 hypothetical protein AU185_17195 [Mycobacterium sp. GA-0227b]KUH83705.1 hypothetical protein AU186_16890 [Mycobacterium sp. GA-1999]
MAEAFDVAARLADGMPGVADIEQYVRACQSLGYQHPDLTAHPAQVRDWYVNEEGMDLGALDTDCVALRAAATAVGDALARQEDQLGRLMTAWQGAGANSSREFLRRHSEASALAAAAVRTAAQAYADLRDRLWRAVDGKVATVLAVGDGVQGRRADWLAASHTVTTGAGDRAVASELVDQEVKPFVDNVIGGQWLAAMRAAVDAVEAAYQAVQAELASEAEATFDVPGEIGPAWTPPPVNEGAVPTAPVGTVTAAPVSGAVPGASASVIPAVWGAPATAAPAPAAAPTAAPTAAPMPPAAAPPAAPSPVVSPPAAPLTDAAMAQPAAAPSLPSLGGGVPDFGSGISRFGQQLGDMLGGLFGDGALGESMELDEPPELTESDIDDALDVDDPDIGEPGSEDGDPDEETDEAADSDEVPEAPGDPAAVEPICATEPPSEADVPPPDESAATPPPDDSAATPPPEPLPAEPLAVTPEPPSDPLPAGSDSGTPCEIAADELPQVGE